MEFSPPEFFEKGKYIVMKKTFKLIAALLAFLMLLSALVACTPDVNDETGSGSESLTESSTESTQSDTENTTVESDTETETETERVALLEGEYAELIENADALKNGVTAYYPNGTRNAFRTVNGNMVYDYVLESNGAQLATIKDLNGNVYVENTMDVYVKMQDGKTYYASKSIDSASANIFRYGYYYYDVHMYEQSFTNEVNIVKSKKFDFARFRTYVDVTQPVIGDDGVLSFEIVSDFDPYISAQIKLSTDDCNALRFTMKTPSSTNMSVYIAAGTYQSANEAQRVAVDLINDGESHTYTVDLSKIPEFEGNINLIRLDFNGEEGEKIEIEKMELLLVHDESPKLLLDRNLHAYTDKLNQVIRFVAKEDVSGIEELGMTTEISTDTVAKLIVKDKNGTHTSLDGVDWDSAEYVGFDIKNVGIFGYILLQHENSGRLTVTLDGDKYVILQTVTPKNNEIKKIVACYSNKDEIVKSFVGESTKVYNSENDFYFGQRIYTDSSHRFDKFLEEAYNERNPLSSENIVIENYDEHPATFDGYDPIRGTYCFTSLKSQAFSGAYYNTQNEHDGVSFTIKGDDRDRKIYVLTYAYTTGLECSAVLDENDMMLPLPIEVAKNFSHEFEVPTFAWGDIQYSETYFPMIVRAGDEQKLTVLHLYQNWGKTPLKQLSSIQYYSPYYHLSTGCSESNCIATHYVHGKDLWTLPDHRATSAPLWAGDPQHTSGGNHYFLQYTDSEGRYSASEYQYSDIDSAGPTYADLDMTYLSDDGRIKVTYTHMEMPQTDENRTYYEMKYEVLEDISFTDFSRDFSFYSVSGFDTYRKIGYLNENNDSVVADNLGKGESAEYLLGDECPYFDMFQIIGGMHADPTHPNYTNGYVNVSFLIHSSDIVIGGEKCEEGFVIVNENYKLRLSLDLEEVTLKAGDTFTINAIIMPWGSQNTDYESDTPDINVRRVRENTLLDPVVISNMKGCEEVESVFMPKLRTTNGKMASFVLTGGENNVVVRAYGFDKLTVPEIVEYVEDDEVEYTVSSVLTPDSQGNRHQYDGYTVHYDGDGTYSYSFVVNMTGNARRAFKISASDGFEGWGEMPEVDTTPTLNVMFNSERLYSLCDRHGAGFGKIMLSDDKSFVRYYGNGSGSAMDAYITMEIKANTNTGRYAVLKYRIPDSNVEKEYAFDIFTSTVDPTPKGKGDYMSVKSLVRDNEWHILIIDLADYGLATFNAETDGNYYAKFVRLDVLNKIMSTDSYVDIQYFGFADSIERICAFDTELPTMAFFSKTTGERTIITETAELEPLPEIDTTSPNDIYAEHLNVYVNPVNIFMSNNENKGKGERMLAEDNSFVRLYGDGETGEAFIVLFKDNEQVTGQYAVIRYRIPTENSATIACFDLFSSTVNTKAGEGNNLAQLGAVCDGEWHNLIVDMTAFPETCDAFVQNENGEYIAKFFRFDYFDRMMSKDSYIDIAFAGLCEDKAAILEALNNAQ